MEVKDSSFTSFSSSPTPASLKTAIRSSTWRLSPISRCWKLWFNWTMLISVKKNTHCYSAFSFLTSHSQTLNALPEENWMLSYWKIFLVPLPGFLSFLVFHCRERCHFPFSSDLITAEKSHRQRYTCTRKTSGFLVSTLLRVFCVDRLIVANKNASGTLVCSVIVVIVIVVQTLSDFVTPANGYIKTVMSSWRS